MVDNTIALQVRPFQMPDVGEIYGAAQNFQLNRMRMEEAQETARERNALRGLLSSGVDLNTPEGMAQLRRAAPMLAPQFEQAASQRAVQQAQVRQYNTRADAERFKMYRGQLGGVNDQAAWDDWRGRVVQEFPQFAGTLPTRFSPQTRAEVAGGAEMLIQRATADDAAARPELKIIDNAPFVSTRDGGNIRLRPVLEGEPPATPPTTPPVTAPAAPPPAAAPAAERVPTSRSTDPLAIDSAIRRAEGTGRNPRSSAQGPYQFLDDTFVEQFRRAFPDAAQGRSDADVLRFRGARLADGRQVEDVLGPAFTQQNARRLEQAGFQPTGNNVYLAHHFGADGALNLLRADLSAPIDRVLTARVLNANPFLRGLAVGQVLQWASNAVDYGPGEARRLLDASRAPAVEPSETPVAAPAAAATPAAAPAARANAMVTPAAGPAPANAFVAASAPAPAAAPARMFPQTPAEARAQRLEQEEDLAFRRERGQLRARSAADARSDLTTTTEALNIIGSITASRPDMPEGRSLLQTATGSFAGAGRDLATRATGIGETYNNIAASELETLQASLVSLLPRMRGDLNKAEFESLQAQAAKIGDRTQTYESRLAAVNALRDRLVRVQQRLARETGTELPPTLETLRPGPAPARPRPNPRGEPNTSSETPGEIRLPSGIIIRPIQ